MSKGGSTTVKDNSTQQVQLPQWMSEAGKGIFDKSMADSAASPVTAYKGELSAPMDANQTAAIAQAKATAGTGQSNIAAGQKALDTSLGTGDRVSAGNVKAGNVNAGAFDAKAATKYMSPYLEDVQKRVVSDMMRNGTIQLADLGDSAASNHAFGGTREGVAQAEATKGINNNILDYLARSQEAGYENAQGQFNTDANRSLTAQTGNADRALTAGTANADRALTAASTNAQLTQAEKDRAVAAGAAMGNLGQQASGVNAESISNQLKTGTVAQQTKDAADQAAYQEALRVQDGTVNRDEDLMAILAGTPRNVTTQNTGTQKTTNNPGWLNTVLGVGGMAASAYSDEQLKRDIVQVGALEDGLPVHEFNYRDGIGLPEGRFRGVLAQEVARFRPWALGPTVNGFATVAASLAAQPLGA